MNELLNIADGYKTYILVVCAIAVVIAKAQELLDAETANTLLMILGFGSVATLRDGIKKRG